MDFNHVTVIREKSIEMLNIKPDGIYVDATLGGGGHSSLICEILNENGTLIGIDRDISAICASKERLNNYKCKKILINDNFSNIKNALNEFNIKTVNGIIADLGVSSPQLDNPERGFSYMKDASLDMRMDTRSSKTAEEIVNTYSEKDLCRIIRDYGEENWAKRIAEFIATEREKKPIKTTYELVEIIKKAVPSGARRDGPHPAKRTFQAIRIEVNGELEILKDAIFDFADLLSDSGRIAIISFHSLEDRLVKESFLKLANPCECPPNFPMCVCGKKSYGKIITRKPILPSDSEIEENPRARSAKLRIFERQIN